MKTPKLLHWHASRAGVSVRRAEVLWRKAIQEATEKTGWVGNAEYWGEAMHRFIALIDSEKSTLCRPDVTSLIRSHHRMMRLPLTAMEDLCTAASAHWKSQAELFKSAA